MEIGRWNKIMEEFQNLVGWYNGIDEVIDIKRKLFPGVDIRTITGRGEKLLVHVLRKRYKELLEYKESRNE
jgi:hypothetical protein